MCFFLDPSPVRRVPIQTGIQRKLNFVSVRTIKGRSTNYLFTIPVSTSIVNSSVYKVNINTSIATLELLLNETLRFRGFNLSAMSDLSTFTKYHLHGGKKKLC
jgi:hypothetical protein